MSYSENKQEIITNKEQYILMIILLKNTDKIEFVKLMVQFRIWAIDLYANFVDLGYLL